MRLLLDTHIWLWLISDPAKIGKHALAELTAPQNEIWISPISTWEAWMLHAKGRIHLSGDPDAWLARATQSTRMAPLTHEIAMTATQLPMHADPADRFLAATAKVLDLTLVTADEKLLGLGSIQSLANR